MQLTKKQKRYAILASILLLLIITNPSISSFKAFRGSNTYSGLKQSRNLFIFSVYQDRDYYLGFLGNFVDITWHQKRTSELIVPAYPIKDSTVVVDSASHTDPFIKYASYKERVYMALKDNLQGFNTSKEDFFVKIKDRDYDLKVYRALKENLAEFNKTPDEFINLVNN